MLTIFFSDGNNKRENCGIYNVSYINGFELIDTQNYFAEEYVEYGDVKEYLLYFNCETKESNQYFKQGDNYFRC